MYRGRPEAGTQIKGRVMERNEFPHRTFLGLTFDAVGFDEVLTSLFDRDPDAPFVTMVTPNADHIYRISRFGGPVADAYDHAWLCVNDSRVVAALSRICGPALNAVPGADIIAALFNDPRLKPDTHILVVGAAEREISFLRERFGLTRLEHFDAPQGLARNPAAMVKTIDAIEQANAQFVILAVGSPQQELIADAVAMRGTARGIGMCVGASLEFLAGTRRRAPLWMRRFGLEWLHRFISEPRRMWRRYFIYSPYIFILFGYEVARIILGDPSPPEPPEKPDVAESLQTKVLTARHHLRGR